MSYGHAAAVVPAPAATPAPVRINLSGLEAVLADQGVAIRSLRRVLWWVVGLEGAVLAALAALLVG